MVSKKIKLINGNGIHLRPASTLCKLAQEYDSEMTIIKENGTYNVKSVISILSACARVGDELEFVCEGDDEVEALRALISCIQDIQGGEEI